MDSLYLSEVIWIIIFGICLMLLVYSYIIYPAIMRWLARGKSLTNSIPSEWPHVSIITAVYNEENVLQEKIESLNSLDYPPELLHIYFGSDNSSDRSNEMLSKYAAHRENVTFIPFAVRQGKIGVINQLGAMALEDQGQRRDHILFYNDANVMLTPSILKTMMRHFVEDKIALVDANMRSRKTKKQGISLAEKAYISSEVILKNNEGLAWGLLQGAFGGCYGLRSTYFTRVPEGFLVDDFFISFQAMVNGGKAINDLEADCFESASHDIWQEFGRKARISAGNFQNLKYFMQNVSDIPGRLLFCFISHKVIRWFGPFLILGMILSSIGMTIYYPHWLTCWISLGLMAGLVLLPLLDYVLLKMGIHLGVLRKIRYFVLMNIALFKGFIRYAKGIRKSFWDPPKRVE